MMRSREEDGSKFVIALIGAKIEKKHLSRPRVAHTRPCTACVDNPDARPPLHFLPFSDILAPLFESPRANGHCSRRAHGPGRLLFAVRDNRLLYGFRGRRE